MQIYLKLIINILCQSWVETMVLPDKGWGGRLFSEIIC